MRAVGGSVTLMRRVFVVFVGSDVSVAQRSEELELLIGPPRFEVLAHCAPDRF